MDNRTLVIADIHGCSRTFNKLLDVIGLERTDTLYLLGDYIDRGPDSRGVIETILQLQKDAFDVRPIRGNHEEMMFLAIRSGVFEDLLEWLENGGNATLKCYGVQHPQDIPNDHLDFLEGLPYYQISEHYVFVHAGLDFSIEDPFSVAGRIKMLWDRSGLVSPKKIGGRTLCSGHCTKKLDYIRKSLNTKHIRLDNGCVYGTGIEGKGNLVAVHLETKKLIIQENIDNI